MRVLFTFLAAHLAIQGLAQSGTELLRQDADKAQQVFDAHVRTSGDTTLVEELPVFPGGEKALYAFLQKETRYPVIAREMGFTGKVFVRFDVEKNGHVDSVVVVRGAHPLLNAEAVRVISAMPDWSPGRQGGEPVRTRYTLPISFTMPQKDLDRIRKKQAKRAAKDRARAADPE